MNALDLPKSKWTKHLLLSKNESIRPHLPFTEVYSPDNFIDLLNLYPELIVKPEWGEGGKYICKVSKRIDGYSIRTKLDHRVVPLRADLLDAMPLWTRQKHCIVQRYINLVEWRGRPTDIRTIVQRNELGKFEVTGTFIKTAPPKHFVTNVKQGGVIAATEKYLRNAIFDTNKRHAVRDTLWRVSEEIGMHLGNTYKNAVYGIDLGLEKPDALWIIEVNTQPNLGILGELDLRMRKRALFLRRYNRSRMN